MALKDEFLGDLLDEVNTGKVDADKVDTEEIDAREINSEEIDADEIDMSDMDALLQAAMEEEDISSDEKEEDSEQQDVIHLSQEEINKMLLESQQTQMPKIKEESADLSDLLGDSEENADLQDIGNMLERADNNEAVNEDVVSLLENVPDAETKRNTEAFDIFSEEEPAEETKEEAKARKAAEKKAKKEAKKAARQEKKSSKKQRKEKGKESQTEEASKDTGTADTAKEEEKLVNPFEESADVNITEEVSEESPVEDKSKEKKKGLFHKFKDFLMEEDEDEDESKSLNLSDENAAILEDMKKEDKKKAKKSKKKKKDKNENKEAAEGEEGEGGKEEEKKKKKKPKKEKPPKEEASEEKPKEKGKKLPIKKVIMIGLVTASIMAVLLVMVSLTGDYSQRQSAVTAYYKGDYQSTYQNLFGKNLNESEQVMFHRSEYILRMKLNQKEYEHLAKQGLQAEALDNLIQTVVEYPELYQNASQWNAGGDVQEIYNQLLQVLQENYHLTEMQAQEIAAEPDDIEYTKIIIAIVNGTSYINWQEEKEKTSMQNVLPEEEELGNTSFLDSAF